MNSFSVKFVCKFQVIKEYRFNHPDQRKSLIRKCIDIARRKNSFESINTGNNDEMFCEVKTANDGTLGILEVDSRNIVFRKISGSRDSTKKTFHHRIENIELVCQSFPNPLYVGYLSRESDGSSLVYIYFSNTQAQAAYQCISFGFSKNGYNTEQTLDETCNYVSMCGKVYKMVNRIPKISDNTIYQDQNTVSSDISDMHFYTDGKRLQSKCQSRMKNNLLHNNLGARSPHPGIVNVSLLENGTSFSLDNPPIDDGDIVPPIQRNTYVIEILNNIPHAEIISYLRQKYEVKILLNSILVERHSDPYEKMD